MSGVLVTRGYGFVGLRAGRAKLRRGAATE